MSGKKNIYILSEMLLLFSCLIQFAHDFMTIRKLFSVHAMSPWNLNNIANSLIVCMYGGKLSH